MNDQSSVELKDCIESEKTEECFVGTKIDMNKFVSVLNERNGGILLLERVNNCDLGEENIGLATEISSFLDAAAKLEKDLQDRIYKNKDNGN